MAAIDYLVITWPEISTVEVYLPVIRDLVRGRDRGSRHGYHGVQGLQSFFGYSAWQHRFLLVLTGAYAEVVAGKIPTCLDPYASLARIDIQSTFRVPNADEFIESLERSRRYKATWIKPEGESGVTLYVGSRASDLFCRVYNKSAEASLTPDGRGEFVRVEFCLRDSYADSIWKKYRVGSLDEVFSALVSRMFVDTSAERILRLARLKLSESDLELLRADNDDWRERRLRWLETIVVPSLNRLIADAPWMEQRVWEALDNLSKTEHNGKKLTAWDG